MGLLSSSGGLRGGGARREVARAGHGLPWIAAALFAACRGPAAAPPPPELPAPEPSAPDPDPTGDTGEPDPLRLWVAGRVAGPLDVPFHPRWPQFLDCGPLTFAAQTGNRQGDKGTALAGTPDGVIHGGNFTMTATFGAGADAVSLTSLAAPYGNGFVARYRHDGALRWVRQQSATGLAAVNEVAVDPADGRVAVGGYYSRSSVTFDGGGRSVTLDEATGDQFVVVYDADGAVDWAVRLGGSPVGDEITGLAFGADGALYVGGTTEDTTVHVAGAAGDLAVPIGTPAGWSAGFLVRLDRDGTPRWGRGFAGTARVEVVGVGMRTDGHVSAAGFALQDVVLAPGSPEERVLAPGGVFTSAWDAAGALVAASLVASPNAASGLDAHTTTSAGGEALAGGFAEGAVWGAGLPGERAAPDWASSVGQLNADGSLAWVGPLVDQPTFNDVNPRALAERGGTLALAGVQIGVVTWGAGTPREVVVDAGLAPDTLSAWEPFVVTYRSDGQLDCFWHLDSAVRNQEASAVAWDGLGGLWVTGWFLERLVLNEGMATEVTFTTVPEDPTDPEGHHEPDVFLARFGPRPP